MYKLWRVEGMSKFTLNITYQLVVADKCIDS